MVTKMTTPDQNELTESISELTGVFIQPFDQETIDAMTGASGDLGRLLSDSEDVSEDLLVVYTKLQDIHASIRATPEVVAEGRVDAQSYVFGVTSALDALTFAFMERKIAQAERSLEKEEACI